MKQKNKVNLLLEIAFTFFFAALLSSCGSSRKINNNYLYFNNGADTVAEQQKETVIAPGDLLSVQVYSQTLNQEQAAIFNIPGTINSSQGSTTGNSSQGSTTGNSSPGYLVDSSGNIYMPVIGEVRAAGLSKQQLQAALVQKLTNYVKNPSVIVRFLQFNVNVLGEVRSPGAKKFITDKVTIFDALAEAGDLTDNGKREDVMVIREEGNKRIYHSIDLRSKAIFESPVYVMQPGDIVYVKPNRNKLKALNIDPEAQRRTGLLFEIISLTVSVVTLFFYLKVL